MNLSMALPALAVLYQADSCALSIGQIYRWTNK